MYATVCNYKSLKHQFIEELETDDTEKKHLLFTISIIFKGIHDARGGRFRFRFMLTKTVTFLVCGRY